VKIFDFGKNTQQCAITFKFDCIGSETTSELVQHFVMKQKTFSTISKGENQQVILSIGTGTDAQPYYQLRISPGEMLLWSGWNVKYEEWQKWRDKTLGELFLLLEEIPIEYVHTLACTIAVGIPAAKLKNPDEVAELAPLSAFYARFLPKEISGKYVGYYVSTDPERKQTVTWWNGSPDGLALNEDSMSCAIRLNVIDVNLSLAKNVAAYLKTADECFERFHTNYIGVMVVQ